MLSTIYDIIWNPLVYITLITGTIYTVATRAVQVRHLPSMIKALFSRKQDEEGTTSFQAFTMSLGGKVGVGNIAGVATAIAYGGPGALFWMIFTAIITASSAFIEATLGQIYKTKADGEYRGGIPWYIEKGLGWKWYSLGAAGLAVLCYTFLVPGVQSRTIATSIESTFSVPVWISGLALTAILAYIVFGGTQRIVKFTEYVVPFMAIAYILVALIICAIQFQQIPGMVSLVLGSAFGTDAIFGGLIGAAVSWGVRRSLYSNVAGVGEGGFAGAAAAVSHPVKQGLVQSFSVYIDTILVCSATGLILLSTDSYNVIPQGSDTPLVEHLPGVEAGVLYTQTAIDSMTGALHAGSYFITVAIAFFAFTSVLSYFYFGITNITYITGSSRGLLPNIIKVCILGSVFLGTIRPTETAWALGDIGYGLIAWSNMFALIFLFPIAVRALKDYERQYKKGLDPVFDPFEAKIKNATFWEGYKTQSLPVVLRERNKQRFHIHEDLNSDTKSDNQAHIGGS